MNQHRHARVKSFLTILALLFSTPLTAQVEDNRGMSGAFSGLASVRTTRPVYGLADPITLEFHSLPGNQQDWITVVEQDAAENTWGQWFYTNGKKDGTHAFDALPAGTYEVRLYFNWPAGQFAVRARHRFQVVDRIVEKAQAGAVGGANGLLVRTHKTVYTAGEPVVVEFSGLPGVKTDWITIVHAGAAENTWEQWFYTDGLRSGTYKFDPYEPGRYEVRAYFNWPDGKFEVRARAPFSVTGTAQVEVQPPPPASQPPPSVPPVSPLPSRPQADPKVETPKSANSTSAVILAKAERYTYDDGERITVLWIGMPNNKGDWVAVVPVGAPENTRGQFCYTEGQIRGACTVGPFPSGEYEVRAFFDWPKGQFVVQSRSRFTVR